MDVATAVNDVHEELGSTVVHQDDGLLRLKVEVVQSVARRCNECTTHTRVLAARHILHRRDADREATCLCFNGVDVTMNGVSRVTQLVQLGSKRIKQLLRCFVLLDVNDQRYAFRLKALHLCLIE